MPILLEACLDSVALAKAAERGGAGRIELCGRLDIGGTTPTRELIESVVAAVKIPVFVIVRPRGGDFAYSDDELAQMKHQAWMARRAGAAGIAVGVLKRDKAIDAGATRDVIDAADGLPTTFHLAFDHAPNRAEALEALVESGVDRILTSGAAPTALEGAESIRSLVEQAAGRIEIMAGGSVREHNVVDLIRRTGVREVHSRGHAVADILAAANSAERGGLVGA